jgi:hypothetical protein
MPSSLYPVSELIQTNSHTDKADYQRLYQCLVDDPGRGAEQG